MKMKMLATSIAVSMPLLLGSVYAQTTSPQSGNNRSSDGGAVNTNPSPAPTATPGTDGSTGAATGMGASTPDTGSAAGDTPPNSRMPGAAPMAEAAASTEAITGWSAKDDIMGKSVFNENDEKVGDINDIVIASDGRGMYVLVGAGGFLGMGEKNVAVPFDRIQRKEDRILLSGYTKEQLKALPEVRREKR